MPFLTGQIADQLAITRQTVRSWASRFSEFLGPAASAEGQTRSFTEDDLQVLQAVATWRKQFNLGLNDIQEQLRRGAHLDLPTQEVEPPPERPEPQTALVPFAQYQTAIDALLAEWKSIAAERQAEVLQLREENQRLREELARKPQGWLQRLFGR